MTLAFGGAIAALPSVGIIGLLGALIVTLWLVKQTNLPSTNNLRLWLIRLRQLLEMALLHVRYLPVSVAHIIFGCDPLKEKCASCAKRCQEKANQNRINHISPNEKAHVLLADSGRGTERK